MSDVLFHRVRVQLDEPALDDVAGATDRSLAASGVLLEPGTDVAIAVGSRGIGDLVLVVERIVEWARAQGATPFLVPAMGSHGGATAEGQRAVLAEYGLGDGWARCPIRSSMEVVPVAGDHDLPVPVVTDAYAAAAAATVVVNRVKQHTDFHGRYESGLMKMTAIGLGKRVQAEALHAHGTAGLRDLMPRVAEHVLANANVVLGVAIVENALDQTMVVQAVPSAEIAAVEPGLLELAAAHAPRLPVDDLDVLLIDRMGKDISGVGLDTNVIGRVMIHGEPDPAAPAHRDDRVPRADPRIARQRHGHGVGRCGDAPSRHRHRPRRHPHQRRHVGLPAARQAAGRRRRRPAGVGAVRARGGRRRSVSGARRPDRGHAALHRAVGDRRRPRRAGRIRRGRRARRRPPRPRRRAPPVQRLTRVTRRSSTRRPERPRPTGPTRSADGIVATDVDYRRQRGKRRLRRSTS